MDFIDYLIAYSELKENPSIDSSFLMFLGAGKSASKMTPSQARKAKAGL